MSMMHALGNKTLSRIFKYITLTALVLFCLSLIALLFWMTYTSFKSTVEYFENSFALPQKLRFDNYTKAAEMLQIELLSPSRGLIVYDFFDMFLISVIWAFCIPFVSLFFTLMVSYVMSKYEWRGRNAIYLLGIVIMVMPIYGSTGMQMVIRKALGMYDNLLMTVITSPGYCFSGMWFLLFYAGWKAIPMEYSEAAFIDGAGHFKSMFAIMMPMMIP
ncbi:MAG: ABC transporter permease subunit, partial [Coriobacteriales bacterium]